MSEPESHADEDDRRPAAEADEERIAQSAEGQLLDDGSDDRDDDAVRDVRHCVVGLPAVRGDALLTSRVEERIERDGEDGDHDADPDPDRERPRPGRRPAECQKLTAVPEPGDSVDDRGDD